MDLLLDFSPSSFNLFSSVEQLFEYVIDCVKAL